MSECSNIWQYLGLMCNAGCCHYGLSLLGAAAANSLRCCCYTRTTCPAHTHTHPTGSGSGYTNNNNQKMIFFRFFSRRARATFYCSFVSCTAASVTAHQNCSHSNARRSLSVAASLFIRFNNGTTFLQKCHKNTFERLTIRLGYLFVFLSPFAVVSIVVLDVAVVIANAKVEIHIRVHIAQFL